VTRISAACLSAKSLLDSASAIAAVCRAQPPVVPAAGLEVFTLPWRAAGVNRDGGVLAPPKDKRRGVHPGAFFWQLTTPWGLRCGRSARVGFPASTTEMRYRGVSSDRSARLERPSALNLRDEDHVGAVHPPPPPPLLRSVPLRLANQGTGPPQPWALIGFEAYKREAQVYRLSAKRHVLCDCHFSPPLVGRDAGAEYLGHTRDTKLGQLVRIARARHGRIISSLLPENSPSFNFSLSRHGRSIRISSRKAVHIR